MTPAEYAELVEYIDDRWGRVESWKNAHHLVRDFERIPAEHVWETIKTWLTDVDKAKWPPKPAELIAAATGRMRAQLKQSALPETTETYGWAEFSRRKYGRVVSFEEVLEDFR